MADTANLEGDMQSRPRVPASRIAFLSSNDHWGGSEELWSRTAIHLARTGVEVSAYKRNFVQAPGPADELEGAGCRVVDLQPMSGTSRTARRARAFIRPLDRHLHDFRITHDFKQRPPDLAVISQGLNYDGWQLAAICQRRGVPYVLISQKASDLYWPPDNCRDGFQAAYRHALAALFVSEHNRVLTEEQLGFRLTNGKVVRNPFNADRMTPAPWPDTDGGYHLVCLARLDAREKGQDLLVRVLAMPKWRKRDLRVSLYGAGQNERGLVEMATMLGLDSVAFAGFAAAPAEIWRNAHGLILPSRCEGLPLSLIEAMLHGRIAVVTDAGGNREAVADGVTGFIAEAATEASLDAALERAWSQRTKWREMGADAATLARTLVDQDPVEAMAGLVLDLAATG
ncbi:MAG: glycosyltransferase family 4 protein [Brevundimonas sp.]|uniref:glycosyltransferase family 4 protein n=1 Tax=Brevundimonas sp. TaxID=1871086 RepID=UPI002ABBFB57|nr:glycosyltransferase family 4 protein [Brevundimonas sp.]MDZ4113561.1 glycosyltransferase family 4 protein [Brevundimonas sp.]